MKPRALHLDLPAGQPLPTHPGKSCGGCTACCSTVPVKEIGLRAFVRCPNLRSPPDASHGCSIYSTRPTSCRHWSCSWLISDLQPEYRPDRLGVVIDPVPDLIKVAGKEQVASQFWVMPGHEDDFLDATNAELQSLIEAVFDQGLALLWRTRGGPTGQKARVLLRVNGRRQYSDDTQAQTELPGYSTDGERLRAAQRLMR